MLRTYCWRILTVYNFTGVTVGTKSRLYMILILCYCMTAASLLTSVITLNTLIALITASIAISFAAGAERDAKVP